jgi:integrase
MAGPPGGTREFHAEADVMKGVYLRRSRWWIRYRFNGKLIRKPIGKDRQLAEAAMAEIRLEITRGRHEERARDERITFEEMADEYLELKETEEKRSIRCDRLAVAKLKEEFGKAWLHEISKEDVKAYFRREKVAVSKKTGKKLEGASLNRRLAILKCLFNCAIESGHLRDNPARGVKKAKEAPWRRKFVLSEEELKALVNAASPHLKPILAIAIGTGLRKGDILRLRWDQIDFRANVITLYQQKTGEPIEIPMFALTRETLLKLKATAGKTAFVLTYRGRGIGNCKTAFRGALKRSKLDVKGYHFHDLRRTFSTMLYNRRVALTKIQMLLGHKSVLTTERYLGIKYRETAEAIEVLDTPGLRAAFEQSASTGPNTSVGGKLTNHSSSVN